ncbi:hypothetical protein D3C75_1175330 [compost metagenome]
MALPVAVIFSPCSNAGIAWLITSISMGIWHYLGNAALDESRDRRSAQQNKEVNDRCCTEHLQWQIALQRRVTSHGRKLADSDDRQQR